MRPKLPRGKPNSTGMLGQRGKIERIDMIKAPFYRGEHVHLIGRTLIAINFVPLVFSFRHTDAGVRLGAVLVEHNDVSLLFSYTRSYFFVDVDRPSELVGFIKTIIPHKPTAEIYISIGYSKHGKTELYTHRCDTLPVHLTNTSLRVGSGAW